MEDVRKIVEELMSAADPSDEDQDKIYALGMIGVIRHRLDELEAVLLTDITI